jgi:glycosyltransferase involved in cell wall biosynthesis
MAHHLTKMGVVSLCDAVVLAAEDLKADLSEVFGFVPERTLNFGIAVDTKELTEQAQDADAMAKTARGARFARGDRLVVGMVGHASKRKGCDIFFETAKALPEHDFIWVGNWAPPEGIENVIYDDFVKARLPNLFTSGGVSNPYKYISRFDLFFLSSREDPNPVVIAESLLLGVPILAFSKTTAVADFLGRSTILCHGHTNVEDTVRILKMMEPSEVRSDWFKPAAEDFQKRFDISEKTASLIDLFGSLQL